MNKLAIEQYIKLTRLDRPIGTYLLLWPTLTALWIASGGFPEVKQLIIFTLGVVFMRSAGCVINDYADRHLDGHVKRTTTRPLAQGIVSEKEALLLFAALVAISFILVLLTNKLTVYMSFIGLALAALYPFMKRHTYLPQVVLGAAFAWAIPMAFTAVEAPMLDTVWLLFTAKVLWTVAYDTQYAMVDRDDDLKIGVRSTAILFGDSDKLMIGLLQALAILTWVAAGLKAELGLFWWLALILASGLMAYQQWLIRDRDRDACFQAFLNNHWVGMGLFIAVVLHYL
ncbi:MAG: 4-hydroxybenzoate polyprenyltransferase [Reinekea sp.]|jgi:4-hydroxybenzoate polyprenyltransferase|uniref:4-hydroxybenzoate octaprenyltransferase n=1 Tax=Reinekea sp. TaxID=1970455 RepID=UPI0039897C49